MTRQADPLPADGADFGASAVQLAGLCAVLLGWAPDAFWRATPAEVAGVIAALAPPGAAPVTGGMIDELEKRCG